MRSTLPIVWVHILLLPLDGCFFDSSGVESAVDAHGVPDQITLERKNTAEGGSTVEAGSGDLSPRDLSPRPDGGDADTNPSLDVRPTDATPTPDVKPATDTGPVPDTNPAVDTTPALDTTPAPDTKPAPDTNQPTLQQLCAAKYGKADSYYFCAATATSCTFHVKTDEDTCQNLCTSFGGSCLGGYDNSGQCGSTGQQSKCSWVHYTQICICSL